VTPADLDRYEALVRECYDGERAVFEIYDLPVLTDAILALTARVRELSAHVDALYKGRVRDTERITALERIADLLISKRVHDTWPVLKGLLRDAGYEVGP